MKKCHQCEETKDLIKFPKIGRKCKQCKAYNLREYRKNNKEYVLKRSKKWRQDNADKIKKQKKESYKRHSDKVKKKNNRYYHNNAEERRAWQKNYQIDKETANVESWLRKCLKHSINGDKRLDREHNIGLEFVIKLHKQQDGKCALSGLNMSHQRDDLFAISIDRIDSKFGHIEENIQLVCSGLNRAKREYSNQKAIQFVEAIRNQAYNFLDFDKFSFPESTKIYTSYKKLKFKEEKLRPVFNQQFEPPRYSDKLLQDDYSRIVNYNLSDYLKDDKWRSHKPENKPWAGKKLVWHFHPHLWEVKTQNKPVISKIWGRNNNSIFERTLNNLVGGQTKISFERIVREFVFAGIGVPSQIHAGFARAVYQYFGCKSGDIVYDPFAGWGGRLLAASSLELKYDAFELSFLTWEGLIKMADFINYDGAHILKFNSAVIEPTLDRYKLMFTSPPFGSEEYIDSQSSVNLETLLESTKNIPLRVLHVNKEILKKLNPDKIIPIGSKNTIGSVKSDEYLAIFS